MLPLAGPLPSSPKMLAEALRRGLEARSVRPQEVSVVGAWPAVESLRIDLTGSQLESAQLAGLDAGTRTDGFFAQRFQLVAAPAQFGTSPVNFTLNANEAVFDVGEGTSGERVATLQNAASGSVHVEIALADLEQLVNRLATKAAGKHGAEIKTTKLQLTSRGPRAVCIVAEVTAKMFIATATVRLSGDLDVDDQLNARLSHLRFDGDGMIANLAGGIVRPQLASLEGRSFPLMSFALGKLQLREVKLETGETVRLSAQLAS